MSRASWAGEAWGADQRAGEIEANQIADEQIAWWQARGTSTAEALASLGLQPAWDTEWWMVRAMLRRIVLNGMTGEAPGLKHGPLPGSSVPFRPAA